MACLRRGGAFLGLPALASRALPVTLDHRQCLDLLEKARVGRLVFTEDGMPAVHPVNFRMLRGEVVIRFAGGAKLAAASENAVVAFQADDLDPGLRADGL